jgi:hypothetical protein
MESGTFSSARDQGGACNVRNESSSGTQTSDQFRDVIPFDEDLNYKKSSIAIFDKRRTTAGSFRDNEEHNENLRRTFAMHQSSSSAERERVLGDEIAAVADSQIKSQSGNFEEKATTQVLHSDEYFENVERDALGYQPASPQPSTTYLSNLPAAESTGFIRSRLVLFAHNFTVVREPETPDTVSRFRYSGT